MLNARSRLEHLLKVDQLSEDWRRRTNVEESTNDIIQLFSEIQCLLLWMGIKWSKKTHISLRCLITKKNNHLNHEKWSDPTYWEKSANFLIDFMNSKIQIQHKHCHCHRTNSILLISFHSEWSSFVVNRDFVHLQTDLKTKLDELKSSRMSARFPDDDKFKKNPLNWAFECGSELILNISKWIVSLEK